MFLRPIAGGGLGLDPSAVTILSTFFVTYTKQLNHPHEMVRSSVQHGLRSAQWRFNQAMGCVSQGLHHSCRAHGTDHDHFLIYTHALRIRVLVPEGDLKVPQSKQHMAVVSSPRAAAGVHALMSAGLCDYLHAAQQQWPLGLLPPLPEFPPQRIWACEVKPPIPKIAPLPTHFFVVHDASYVASTYQAGGGLRCSERSDR